MNNLAGAQPERVRQLAAQWLTWAKRTHVDIARDPFAAPAGPGGKQKKKKK